VKDKYLKRHKCKKNKTRIDKNILLKIDENTENSEYKNLYEDCKPI